MFDVASTPYIHKSPKARLVEQMQHLRQQVQALGASHVCSLRHIKVSGASCYATSDPSAVGPKASEHSSPSLLGCSSLATSMASFSNKCNKGVSSLALSEEIPKRVTQGLQRS